MLESELVSKFIEYLRKKNIKYATEIHMGIGVPDISLNIGVRKNINTFDDYFLLSICEYIVAAKKISINDIEKHFHISKNKLMNYLNFLYKSNYIRINDKIVSINHKIFPNKLGTTISIEVKLKDWKNGLIQAQRYLGFSDYSYLLLPIDKIKNVKKDEMLDTGVGLLSIDVEGNIIEQISPQKSKICDYKQKYIITSAIVAKSYNMSRMKDNIFKNY